MGGFRLVGGLLDECLNFAEVFSKLLIDIALALVLLAAGGIEVNHHGRAGHQQGKESKQSQKAEGDFPVGPAGQENGERHTRRHHGNAQICQPGGEEIHGKAAQDGSNPKENPVPFFPGQLPGQGNGHQHTEVRALRIGVVEPANDASAVCVSAGVCASDDADDLHCQGEKQGSGEAQLHAFKAPVILAEEGDEAQDGNGHLNNADVIGEI